MPLHNTSHGNRPTVRPSLLLDFANSKDLDPRVIFSRASSATYWDGKSTSKAEENLFVRSQEMNNSGAWDSYHSDVYPDDTTAPDGTTTAERLEQEPGTTNNCQISQTHKTITGVVVTCSIYAKAGTRSWLGLRSYGVDNNPRYSYFDLANGATGTTDANFTTTISSAGNGWYRCTLTLTPQISQSNNIFVVTAANTDGTENSPDDGGYIYVWGAQAEFREQATAYTPTTDIPITRYQPLMKTAITNEPRFDHDPVTGESKGLLIEEGRTNLDTSSDTINFLYNTTSNNNYGIAPDGTQSADLGAFQASGAAIGLFNGNKPTNSGAYTWSVFVKKFGDINVIRVYDNNANVYTDFNIDIGTVVGGNASRSDIIDVGNGWYRVWMSSNVSTNTTYFQVYGYDSIGSVFNTINGYNGIFVWGSQVEQGNFPTSYIPTYGQSIPRNEERAYVNVESILDVHKGTIYAESISGPIGWDASGQYNVFHYGNSNDDGYGVFKESGSGDFWFHLRKNNTSLFNVSNGSQWNSNTLSKVAISFDPSTQKYFVDGAQVGGTQTTSLYQLDSSDITELQIGFTGNSGYFNGHIKKIAAYDTILPDNTLQAITEE